MIGRGTLLLLRNDAMRQLLMAQPDLVEAAVEELLCFVSPVQFSPRRVVLEDAQIGGVRIPKGEGLFMLPPSANRDERVFERPDELDFTRAASSHLTFG
jgi:cytochrome P450